MVKLLFLFFLLFYLAFTSQIGGVDDYSVREVPGILHAIFSDNDGLLSDSNSATFVVNQDEGNDQNTCTKQKPCKTILRALTVASKNPEIDAIVLIESTEEQYPCLGNHSGPFTFGGQNLTLVGSTNSRPYINCAKLESAIVVTGSNQSQYLNLQHLDFLMPGIDHFFLKTTDVNISLTHCDFHNSSFFVANVSPLYLWFKSENYYQVIIDDCNFWSLENAIAIEKFSVQPITVVAKNSSFVYSSFTYNYLGSQTDIGTSIKISNCQILSHSVSSFVPRKSYALHLSYRSNVENLQIEISDTLFMGRTSTLGISLHNTTNLQLLIENSIWKNVSVKVPVTIEFSNYEINSSIGFENVQFVESRGGIYFKGGYVARSSTFLARNCYFSECWENAPINFDYAASRIGGKNTLTIENCTFFNNRAYIKSFALSPTPTLSAGISLYFPREGDLPLDCSTESQDPRWKSWIYTNKLTIINSNFTQNGCFNCSGGGLHVANGLTTVINSIFSNNTADLYGSNIYVGDGSGSLVLQNTIIDTIFGVSPFAQGRGIYSSSRGSISLTENSRLVGFESDQIQQFLIDLIDIQAGGGELIIDNTSLMVCPQGQIYSSEYSRVYSEAMRGPIFFEMCYFKYSFVQNFCKPCPETTYSLARGTNLIPNSDFTCHPCPYGGNCQAGGSWIRATPHYWGYTNDFYNDIDPQIEFVQCPLGYCCVSRGNQTTCPYQYCNGNREGILCGSCKKGYSLTLGSTECVLREECGKTVFDHLFWIFIIFTSFGFALYFIIDPPIFNTAMNILLWKHMTEAINGPQSQTQLQTQSNSFREIPLRASLQESNDSEEESHLLTWSDSENPSRDINQPSAPLKETSFVGAFTGYTKSVFYFYQVLPLLLMQRQSEATVFQSSILSLLNLQIQGGSLCPVGLENMTPIMERVMALALPFFVLAAIAVCFFVTFVYCKIKKLRLNPSLYFGAVLQTLLFSYSNITSTFFLLVYCVKINGDWRLWIEGTRECTADYILPFASIIIFFVIPFPLILVYSTRLLDQRRISLVIFLLSWLFPICGCVYLAVKFYHDIFEYAQRQFEMLGTQIYSSLGLGGTKKNDPSVETEKALQAKSELSPENYMIAIVTAAYKSEHWYWEAVFLGRRLLFITVRTLIISPLTRGFMNCVFSLFAALHHIYTLPFNLPSANLLESVTLLTLTVISFGQLIEGVLIEVGITLSHSAFHNALFWFQQIAIAFIPACLCFYFVIAGISGLISLVPWLWQRRFSLSHKSTNSN